MSRTFLIEIEKAECITILATNKTITMDPALDRRISLKIPFALPNEKQRRAIWQALLPSGMEYTKDVDLFYLASKFHFTGGLIKNTLLMAACNTQVSSKNGSQVKEIDISEIINAAKYQVKSMFELNMAGKLIRPGSTLNDLNLCRVDKDRIEKIATIIQDLNDSNRGLCCLICSDNILVGTSCIEAVASKTGSLVRQFLLSTVLNNERDDKLFDPLTQEPLNIVDFIFQKRPGQQELIIVEDDINILPSILEEKDTLRSLPVWYHFRQQMKHFKGTLFVISRNIPEYLVPMEFSYYLSLSYPPEDTQIETWKNHFSNLTDSSIVDLVEQFPMYIEEINLVANNIEISSRLNDLNSVSVTDIIQTSRRHKRVKTLPFLFGHNNHNLLSEISLVKTAC